MVHANIHSAHQSTFHSTYKHSFCTLKHILKYLQTFIFHTKAYYMVHTNIHFSHKGISHGAYKHSFYTPKHIALHIQNIHIAHQFKRPDQALSHVNCVYSFILFVLSIHLMHVACGLWVLQTASVTATCGICGNELCMRDAHLGSALVRNVVMQSTLHKLWLPHGSTHGH